MKQPITIPEQISLLKSRKLGFEDELKAEQFLLKNNYYRLSGYWRKYQTNPDKRNDTFINGATFEKIVAIYDKIFKDYESARHIIRSLVYLRNLCAHQARIWNREMVVQVTNKKYLQPFGNSTERSMWKIISILMLLIDEINQNKKYSTDVLNLCKQNEDFYMGLTEPTL